MVDFVHSHPELARLPSIMDTKGGLKCSEVMKYVGVPEHRTLLLVATSPIHGVVGSMAARISTGRILLTGCPSSAAAVVCLGCVFFPLEQCSEFCLSTWCTAPSLFKTPSHCIPKSILGTPGGITFSLPNDGSYWMNDAMRGTRRPAPSHLTVKEKLIFHVDGQRTLMHAPFSGRYITHSHFFLGYSRSCVDPPPPFF